MRITRRTFISATTANVVAGNLLPLLSACRSTKAFPSGSLGPLGLQLYTVRDVMKSDFDGTLARVAQIGYREVEFAGYFGRDATQVRSALKSTGLIAPSAHVPLSAFEEANVSKTLEDAHTVGHRFLVVASIAPELRNTLDGFRRVGDQFNKAAEAAAKAGIAFAYHNHAFEFERIDGQLPYDVLLESTDPKLVALEMDLYWITKGGQDPLEYFQRWPGRIKLVHAKDSTGAPEHKMTDVGSGTIGWPQIFAKRRQAGIEHVFVERDDAPDPFASIEVSYRYLKGKF